MRTGLAGHIAKRVIDSPVVPLFILASLLLGAYALLTTPREDRPDIEVPTALVMIPWPGAGVEQIDNQLARRAASWIREIASVSEVRSASASHAALLTVEFSAGTAQTTAFAELNELFLARADSLPENAGPVRIETFGEARLAVLLASITSKTLDPARLEDIATELATDLQQVAGVRSVERFGGYQPAIEVLPRPTQLAARNIPLPDLAKAIASANRQVPAGRLQGTPVTDVQAGIVLERPAELGRIPVGKDETGPIYLNEVADIQLGRTDDNQAVLYWQGDQSAPFPAVTLAVTTIEGANVSEVTHRVQQALDRFADRALPAEVRLDTTYDAGIDAAQRVYDVLIQLLTGTLVVIAIIWLGLGWRAALIIAVMMPVSLAIVPFLYDLLGFTLNPISIAAMILAIGILSDDAVVMLENIARHFRRAGKKSRELTVAAVNEVGNPTILADLLVVATLLPTAYIGGEMGQYVRALPVGASAAVLFSLLVALAITPYLALRLLKVDTEGSTSDRGSERHADQTESEGRTDTLTGYYRRALAPFIRSASLRWLFYLALVILLLASFSLVGLRLVQVGLTPLLDRNIFAIDVELPATATLTDSLTAASDINRHLRQIPEVQAVTVYAGMSTPLIYPPESLSAPVETAPGELTLHVILVSEEQRDRQSYEIGRDIAHNLNSWLAPHDGIGHIGRIPSGPSSDRDITAEIYGPTPAARQAAADQVEQWLRQQEGVISTQQRPSPTPPRLNLEIDPQRSAIHGVTPAEVTRTLNLALRGVTVTHWSAMEHYREPVPVIVRLAESERDTEQAIRELYVTAEGGQPVPLESIVDFVQGPGELPRLRRDLMPLITVVADLDRSRVQPVSVQLESRNGSGLEVDWMAAPDRAISPRLYWSGEWEATRDVYRDLGAAALVVMLLIYVLLAGWFRSYLLPLLIMLPIPLVFIGVIPAHWAWGINIAGTGVLGVIALGGIVARNAVLLVDFIEKKLEDGLELQEAVIQAGAQRTRPIILTAATVMFGSGVLIFEPSLEPLGLTLASGVLVSTLLTLILIPVLYFHVFSARVSDTSKRG